MQINQNVVKLKKIQKRKKVSSKDYGVSSLDVIVTNFFYFFFLFLPLNLKFSSFLTIFKYYN